MIFDRLSRQDKSNIGLELIPLVDDFYNRVARLSDLGWTEVACEEDFAKSICSKEEYRYEQVISIELIKAAFSRAYSSELLERHLKQKKEAEAAGLGTEAYRPCRAKLDRLGKQFAAKNVVEWKNRCKQCRDTEINKHNYGLWKDVANTGFQRSKLYQAVMEGPGRDMGFKRDRKLSIQQRAVYSKELEGPWKACFSVEYLDLEHEVSPSFHLSFGLTHEDNKGLKGRDSLFYPVFFFYPLGRPPFHFSYCKFKDNRELETVILFHLEMYRLIQGQFEDGLRRGLAHVAK